MPICLRATAPLRAFSVVAVLMVAACGGGGGGGPSSSDDDSSSCTPGTPGCSTSADPCRSPNRYDDAICDTDCAYPDQACQSPGDTCATEHRYGDGPCDAGCPQHDPDCDGVTSDTCMAQNRYGDGPCDACPNNYDSDCANVGADPCTSGTYGNTTCEACRYFDPGCWSNAVDAPTEVNASDAAYFGHVRVTFRPSRGAKSHRILRASSAAGSSSLVQELPARPVESNLPAPLDSFDDTSAAGGVTYWYEVVAVGATASSSPSSRDPGSRAAGTPLAAPAGVTAEAQGSAVMRVSWSAVAGATYYQVYMATSAAGLAQAGAVRSGTSDTTLDVGGGTPGATRWFAVSAQADVGAPEGPLSSPVSAAFEPAPTLAAPVGLVGNAELDQVTLSWSSVSGATHYRVYAHPSFTPVAVSGDVFATTFTYSGTYAGDYLPYSVRAFAGGGTNSPASTTVSVQALALDSVTNLAVNATGAHTARVTWSPVTGAAQYRIWRGAAYIDVNQLVTTQPGTTLDDTGLPAEAQVFYRVRAVAPSGRLGDDIAPVSATTLPILNPPTNVAATQGYLDYVTVSWDAVVDATHYTVESFDGAAWNTVSGDVTALSFDFYPPEPVVGSYRSYRVVAHNVEGASAPSSTASGRALRITPPLDVAATGGVTGPDTRPETMIVVTWVGMTEAASYRIYRSAQAGGTFALVGTALAGEVEFEDDTAELGFLYWYRVVAVSAGGNPSILTAVPAVQGWTDVTYALSHGGGITPPATFTVVYDQPSDTFNLAWSAAGAGSYIVSRFETDCSGPCDQIEPGTRLGTTTSLSYADVSPPSYPTKCFTYALSCVRADGLESMLGKFSNVACRP